MVVLQTLYSWEVLDPVVFESRGIITGEFVAIGVRDFRAAAAYVNRIPYGRTSNRDDLVTVLREARGTCSTKHALLNVLAQEQGIQTALVIGIYRMNGRNTPGIAPVLERYGLDSLPEAHCFLRYREKRVDVTQAETNPSEPISEFLYEEDISPGQIGDYKTSLHRHFLRQWMRETGATTRYSLDELWQIREVCIAALGVI